MTADPGPPPCVNVSVQVDGTPVNVDQTQCAPAGAPSLPTPTIPSLPTPTIPSLPAPTLPQLPAPTLPLPNLPAIPTPSVPPVPQLPMAATASAASVGDGLCNYDSVRPTPPPASEQTVTLPGGTTIYHDLTVDPSTKTVSGYLGGTNPMIGTLEGGGSGSPAGVTGQVDGQNVQTGLSGYLGTSGACLGK